MRRTYSFIVSAIMSGVVAAMLAAVSPEAMAQDQQFSQEQIEAFAGAAVEVQRVKTDLDAQAAQAANPDEVAQLQQQAQADASQAVQDSGLTIDEYSAIAEAATADPSLYAMIVDLMRQQMPQ